MFVKKRIEDAAALIVSGSLAANNISGWQIDKGLDTTINVFPCVKVVCKNWTPYAPENRIGHGSSDLEIIACAVKVSTDPSDLETICDYIFNPFLADNAADQLAGNTTNLQVSQIIDGGWESTTLKDGWIIFQKFKVVCSMTP